MNIKLIKVLLCLFLISALVSCKQNIVATLEPIGILDSNRNSAEMPIDTLVNEESSSTTSSSPSHPYSTPTEESLREIKLSLIDNESAGKISPITKIPLSKYYGRITKIAFSSDSKILAAITEDGILIIIRLNWTSGSSLVDDFIIDTYSIGESRLRDIAFSPDNHLVAIAGPSSRLTLFSGVTGEILASYQSDYYPLSVVFTEDGSKLALGSSEGVIELWSIYLPYPILEIANEPWKLGVCDLAVSPDGSLLAAGFCDYNMLTWDIHQNYVEYKRVVGTDHWECFSHCPGPTHDITFHPDGDALISGTDRNFNLPLIDIDSGRLVHAYDTNRVESWVDPDSGEERIVGIESGSVNALAFNSDGSILAISTSYELQVLDTSSGKISFLKLYEAGDYDVELSLSPNGYLLATSHDKNVIQLWGVQTESNIIDAATSSPLVDVTPVIDRFLHVANYEEALSAFESPDTQYLNKIIEPNQTYIMETHEPLLWGSEWCAKTPELLNQNLFSITTWLHANGNWIDPFLYVSQFHGGDESTNPKFCRGIYVLIDSWPVGMTCLEIHRSISETINDGWSDHEAGKTNLRYCVDAK